MAPRLTLPIVVAVSFICTALTITNALMLKKQFYPSVVYITKNNLSMAVMYGQGAVLAYLAFTLVRYIFFGQLRAAEIEHAQDRVWHAIMETCLAFAVFRDDFSPKFVVQFVILFFVKAFHWLAEDRVDYMERSPLITLTFHARILGISALLSLINSHFISSAYFYTISKGASAQIVFGFEYAVLMTMVMHIVIKYLLHTHDLQQHHPWENKAVYMLYAELFINFLRVILYFMFFFVMIKIHTFPLFAIRQCYLTVRSFQKALNDVYQSRRAIHAMNHLFPLATQEELTQGDATCIICREEMTVESGAKKLPCNHIFHPNCLRSWFQRQQTCPTCRTDILAQRRPNIIPGQNQGPQNGGINLQQGQGPQIINGNPIFRQIFGPFQQNQIFGGQQPQQIPQIQPQLFPFMAHNFAFPPPPLQQPGQAQGQNDGQQQQQPGQDNQQGTSGIQQPQQQLPHFPMPPMFGANFPIPPPMLQPSPFPFPQPPAFSGLSNEEIARMEGTQRAAVEARLEALNNITVLLDAAVLQFQQYLSVVNTLPLQQNPLTTSSGTSGAATATTTTDQASTENLGNGPLLNGTTINGNGTSIGENEPSTSEENDNGESISNMSPEDAEGLEELRRRRLRFLEGAAGAARE